MTAKTIDDHFRDWETEVFGYGYGSGERHILGSLKLFLAAVGREDSERGYNYEELEAACGPVACWLFINIFGHHDLIDYGVSPRYGWLTETGEALKTYVATKTLDELVKICTSSSEDDCCCAPSFCNCGPDGFSEKKLCHNPFWTERNFK